MVDWIRFYGAKSLAFITVIFNQEQGGGAKLVLWDATFTLSEIMRSCNCLCVTCD